MKIERFRTGPRMSMAVRHGNTIYVAGQVASKLDATVEGQMLEILEKLDELLREAGSDKSRLLTTTIWLADICYYARINAVWDHWVVPDHAPARVCVQGALVTPQHLVEVAVTAAEGIA